MIRGDILNAKVSQTSIQHQRETSSLGRIQERESNSRHDVQRREQRFWKEISQVTVARAEARDRPTRGARGAPLERALEAYRLLRDAKAQHHGVSRELCAQVSKVMRTKYAVDTFTKMRAKQQVRSHLRNAERVGERIDETVTQSLARRSTRQVTRAEVERLDLGSGRDATDSGVEQHQSLPPKGIEAVHHPMTKECLVDVRAPASVRVTDELSLQSLRFDLHKNSPTLTLAVEHKGSPLECRLVGTPSGELGVVVGVAHGELSDRIERGRPGLLAKLSELGVKVSSLEVRRDTPSHHSLEGGLRRGRRNHEERDENTIA